MPLCEESRQLDNAGTISIFMSNRKQREHLVAQLSELSPAPSMQPFEIGDTKGLLIRLEDGLHAISGLCPHAQAPLHEGALCGTRLVCPWHHSVFEVTSGALLEPPALDGLERFKVRTSGDEVFVALPEPPPAPAAAFLPRGSRTVLVVGAGAAGQVAVETLRKEGFDGRIVLAGPEPDAPYDRTNLSKHFLSGQAQRDDLPLRSEPGFLARIGVERKAGVVMHLDARTRTATFDDRAALVYDSAILATGAYPKPLDIPGADHPRVCLLRTVADAERILALTARPGARAVAIGASFIGMEAVSSLAQRKIDVTVISPDEVPFARQLGREVGASIRQLHEQNGVLFLPDAKVMRIAEAEGSGVTVQLADGRSIPADVVIVGIGVRPATDFVEGVERQSDGGIVVDEFLQAAENLYAVGDVASFPLPARAEPGGRARIEHWRVAQQHAALAARNVARPTERQSLQVAGFVPFFWTFHFGQRMNYVGHASEWDEIIFDGDPKAPPFIAYYVRGDRVVSAAGTHRDADLAAMHELLRLERAPTGAQLRGGGFYPFKACRQSA